MLAKLFHHSSGIEAGPTMVEQAVTVTPVEEPAPKRLTLLEAVNAPAAGIPPADFDAIYLAAMGRASTNGYHILKVSDMLASPYLSGLSPDGKRCALLMALDAAGASLDELLQDAMLRQRALNEYEQALEERLRKFETTKTEENRQIQAELDRLAAQYKGRIQSNLNQVERDQDELRAWQRRKAQECARITEAASACVSPQSNTAAGPSSLTVVLERAAGAGR
ncbi:MAG: hypothetical protein ABSH56_16925 [Bryobacteraceae bacterium]|jgi:hypothetical protein